MVCVCVSHNVLHFNNMTELVAVRNLITKKKKIPTRGASRGKKGGHKRERIE